MTTATAWELIGLVPDNARVRIQGGRALYDEVIFWDDTPGEKVLLARLDVGARGLKQVNRYVEHNTVLEIVYDD
jgi:hypothetical protein